VNATGQGSQQTDMKPTIVLVHGAFADASSWNGVIERLQQQGYTVIAPANPLRGVTADSAYIASLLGQIGGPVLLAGTPTAARSSPMPRPAPRTSSAWST
jgi:pimeloyl-ACP methyl ester carboxylesterase